LHWRWVKAGRPREIESSASAKRTMLFRA
jgi:hypothetical protein